MQHSLRQFLPTTPIINRMTRRSLREQVAISAGGGGMVNQGLIAGGPMTPVGKKKKRIPESHSPSGSSRWKVVVDQKISDESAAVLKQFLRFCQKKLVIKKPPVIYLLSKRSPGMTTGGYSPSGNTIMALSANRLLLDVLKTLAHELTHRMQDERGDFSDLKPRVDENDNSDLNTNYENEAYINSGNYVKEFCRLYRGEEKERLYSLHESMFSEIPEPEADAGDPFGQYLFGPERNLPSKKAPEENTDDEKSLERDMNDHYMGGMTQINKWISKLVALDQAGKYQSVLHVPDKYPLAWRAMTVKRHALQEILGRPLSEEELAEPAYGKKTPVFHQDSGDFKGKFESRVHFSWTINPSVFKKMQQDWGRLANSNLQDKWIVFLQASVPKNTFLINPDVMQKTNIPDAYGYQKEVISVGDIACNGVWFVRLGFGPPTGQKSSEDIGVNQVISANRRRTRVGSVADHEAAEKAARQKTR
jgi:hypothetical protein